MVKKPFFRPILKGQRACLRMAARAEVVPLLFRHGLSAEDTKLRQWVAFGVAFSILLCSAEGPWQVSQLMPGSAHVVW